MPKLLFSENNLILRVKILDYEETKGVVLVKYEDGTEKLLPKIAYLRMKKYEKSYPSQKERNMLILLSSRFQWILLFRLFQFLLQRIRVPQILLPYFINTSKTIPFDFS